MSPLARGLVIAAVQAALVAGVAGKLLYDRHALPRAWAPTTGVDPYLPIRGRYVALRLVVEVDPADPLAAAAGEARSSQARLSTADGSLLARLIAQPDTGAFMRPEGEALQHVDTPTGKVWALAQPIAFFLPEAGPDPTRLAGGETLWAEVTVPPEGPPRPIRLEVRR